MEENLFLEFYNETSKRHVVIEDDGLTAWFYLHEPSDDPHSVGNIKSDAFVYNRGELITPEEVPKYRDNPPPIAQGFGGERSICDHPENYEWAVNWFSDGESAVLFKNDEPWAMILQDEKYGYSKSVVKEGPWGHPWNEGLYKYLANQGMDFTGKTPVD